MKRVILKFDKRTHPYGSKEHFWHFMLGYLLPSVHFYFKSIIKKSNERKNEIQLIYDGCGPLMNPLIHEIATLLDIPYEISSPKEDHLIKSIDEIVYLPRWDIRLFTSIYFVIYKNRYDSDIPITKNDLKDLLSQSINFRQKAFGINLKKDVLFTRNLILNKIGNVEKSKKSPFLFLERSDCHIFYTQEGKAEIKGYGKSRRSLKNLQEASNDLNQKGISAELYEPGLYSLIDQIKKFNSAKGIIAIRGAELVNMIWLEPKSRVIVIGFIEPGFHLYNYACLLNLKLIGASNIQRVSR